VCDDGDRGDRLAGCRGSVTSITPIASPRSVTGAVSCAPSASSFRHIGRWGPGARLQGGEQAETVPLAGTVYKHVLRTQQVDVHEPGRDR
jgi:hypothetical protein